jgi:hypothetical protein
MRVKDRARLSDLERELATLARRHKTLSWVRGVVFVLLYASILSNLALPALAPLVKTVTLLANLIGASILALIALYLTWRLGHLWNRMVVLGAHVIAIYEKHTADGKHDNTPRLKKMKKEFASRTPLRKSISERE